MKKRVRKSNRREPCHYHIGNITEREKVMNPLASKISVIRGMRDVLPKKARIWEELELSIQKWLHKYGYCNLRTPILEKTELFIRCIGEITDIVEKEMYSFKDRLNGDELTIRPEMTAGLIRASIENNLLYNRPYRIYSIGPVFRHERPQAGRYRQFHQVNVEALGFHGPDVDAELIIMLSKLWKELKLGDIQLELNTLGQAKERAAHKAALVKYFEKNIKLLDQDSCRRLNTNPLRILDTKNPAMQELISSAPKISNFLGDLSHSHFKNLCCYLDDFGIKYQINPRLVRGLDYYNLTVFEWTILTSNAQKITVCGGGRYDGLSELIGGNRFPAAGFAIGIERLLSLLENNRDFSNIKECDAYIIVHQDDASKRLAMKIAENLRDIDLSVVYGSDFSIKKQSKRANNSGAKIILNVGPKEVSNQVVFVKLMQSNLPPETVALNHLSDFVKSNMDKMSIRNYPNDRIFF